jgi:hypothetical protein
MDPAIWGPHMWYVLHLITMTYPKEPSEYMKRAYHDFFYNLKDVLPCEICKAHYSKFIKEYPLTPHLDTRENVVKWLIQIHNFVNLELKKPVLDVAGVLSIYGSMEPSSPFDPVIVHRHIEEFKIRQRNTIYKLQILLAVCIGVIILIKWHYSRTYYVL